MNNNINDFIDKFKELFIINSSKIDNGFYKYLYYRQNTILDYINIKLRNQIDQLFYGLDDQNLQLDVLNFIYRFFQNYYDNGFFVNKQQIKLLQYQEPKLYWNTQNCYYIGSFILLQNYNFILNNYNISFIILNSQTKLFNVMDDKNKYYILKNIEIINNNEIRFLFEFRELLQEQINKFHFAKNGYISRQREINKYIIYNELQIYFKQKQNKLLYKELNKFTMKKRVDYFIHKNLKKFLSEQLDYYIKNEVLDIDALEKESFLDKHITRAKMVREIGEDIIDFLAQIEDFQKRLWEKKKFVLSTDYVITLDKIREYAGEEFLSDIIETILKNEKQLKEWEEMDFGKIDKEEDLYLRKDLFDAEYKKLPLDTKYFSEDFKEQLLENITKNHNLDDILDGLLIKSENWQALNTILEKYKEQVQTIYIDPPFNTGSDFAYLDKYQDSTWLTLMENRIDIARLLLNNKGIICLHLDPRANYYGRIILDNIFGKDQFINEIIWAYEKARYSEKKFKENHENLFLYSRSDDYYFKIQYVPRKGETELTKSLGRHQVDYEGKISPDYWVDIPSFSTAMTAGERSIKLLRIYFETQKPEKLIGRILETTSNESNLVMDFFLGSGTTTAVAQKLGRKWIGIEMGDHFWTVVMPRMKKVLFYDRSGISKEKDVKERYNENKAGGFFKYQILEQYEDTLDNLEINTIDNEQMELEFGDKYLLRYFLEYETKDNPSLLNIEKLQSPFSYKLKVNLEEVGEPEEMVVDLPETFNYLLGIKVKKVKVRNSGRKYLFIEGEKDKQEIAIIWREYDAKWEEKDYEEDKKFIREELKEWTPQVVYINGQSILTPVFEDFRADIRSIESEFKRLMG